MLFFVSFPQSTLEVKIPVSGCVVSEASQKNLSNAFQARNCTRMHSSNHTLMVCVCVGVGSSSGAHSNAAGGQSKGHGAMDGCFARGRMYTYICTYAYTHAFLQAFSSRHVLTFVEMNAVCEGRCCGGRGRTPLVCDACIDSIGCIADSMSVQVLPVSTAAQVLSCLQAHVWRSVSRCCLRRYV